MQKLKQELNSKPVGATSSRPRFEEITLKNQKGITLIALIITIIVMLILVGVTINVALNGGLFTKAEEATTKTKIAQIQEALTIKKAEVLAENDGKAPDDFGITIDELNLPAELETEYENKLIVSTDGKLYYDASEVTDKEEQDILKSMGIEEYVEKNTGELLNSYTFTIADLMKKGRKSTDMTRVIPVADFWPENVSDELKNNAFDVNLDDEGLFATNVTCSDQRFTNLFASGEPTGSPGDNWSFYMALVDDEIYFVVCVDDSISYLQEDNYIGSGFENLEITIGLPE